MGGAEERTKREGKKGALPYFHRNILSPFILLHNSTFWPVLLRLDINTHDGWHISTFPNTILTRAQDFLRDVSDVAVRCYLG